MEHFRVLPTDQRFLNLNDEQMELLFMSFLNSPPDEAIRQSHHSKASKKDLIESMPKDLMGKMGYSKEDLQKIADEVKQARHD